MPKLNNYFSVILSIISIISVALLFVRIEKFTNLIVENSANQQKQNQLTYQKNNKEKIDQKIALQPSIPEIKPYLIRLYDNRAEPDGYVIKKNTSIEVVVENKSTEEVNFLINELNIEDKIKPNENKKYKIKIPDLLSGTQIEWKINKENGQTVGMFIVE